MGLDCSSLLAVVVVVLHMDLVDRMGRVERRIVVAEVGSMVGCRLADRRRLLAGRMEVGRWARCIYLT